MLRLFSGLALPPSLCQQLHLLQGGIPGARWTTPENFHVTLTFIGDVDEGTAEDVDDALSSVRAPAFDLALQGMDSFAQGDDPKVLWAGIRYSDDLFLLKGKIDGALEHARIDFEKRKYIPHVTLARFRHPDNLKISDFMQAHGGFSPPSFPVVAFALYQSRSTKQGAMYEILKTYPLVIAA